MASKRNKQSEDVISRETVKAILTVDGVSGLSSVPIQFNIRAKELCKGLAISGNDEEGLILDIFIDVFLGTRIPQTAFAVQEAVKKAVDEISGVKIIKINIHVQGIDSGKNEEN